MHEHAPDDTVIAAFAEAIDPEFVGRYEAGNRTLIRVLRVIRDADPALRLSILDAMNLDVIDRIIEKVLGDPARRLAILNLIGDVQEGYLDPNKRGMVAILWPLAIEEIAAPGKLADWQRAFVVRPRGEATDA